MSHRRFTHPFRRSLRVGVLAALATYPASRAAWAQTPQHSQPPAATLPAYRPPVLALVQPSGSATVPQDVPVVVFRYAQGEPDDGVDLRSFRVLVDGDDRTSLFQMQDGKAWGPLIGTGSLPLGSHTVTARLCSTRGACAAVTASVTAVAPDGATATKGESHRDNLLGALLAALRELLEP